jgi:hypothetical protein
MLRAQGDSMQILVTDINPIHRAVQAELYTALELLRLCERKIEMAREALPAFRFPADLRPHLDHGDDGDTSVDGTHLDDIEAVAFVNATILQEICTGLPVLPERIFADLLAYEGYRYDPPHLGGLCMILQLATRHLGKALNLSADHDGTEIDDAYRLMNSVYLAVGNEANCLESLLRYGPNAAALTRLLKGERVLV